MLDLLKRLFGKGEGGFSASHPGRVTTDVLRYAARHPGWPVALGLLGVLSTLAVLDGFDNGAWVLLGLALASNLLWWSNLRSWFQTGDVCPAVVVSLEPLLVAAHTDLTIGEEEYPAIKVIRENPKHRDLEDLKIGAKVACVARYASSPGAQHHSNFFPRPAQHATSDPSEVQRLLSEIDQQRWSQLQSSLRQLPQPLRPGLYHLRPKA